MGISAQLMKPIRSSELLGRVLVAAGRPARAEKHATTPKDEAWMQIEGRERKPIGQEALVDPGGRADRMDEVHADIAPRRPGREPPVVGRRVA